jgi:Type I phosphodiesterase / nucleotide pyrophosphatase
MATFKFSLCRVLAVLLVLSIIPRARASAYDAHPKLIVIVVIDQFRADYLDRYRSDFKGRGFRLFLDHGAYFEDCYYDYANTVTAPGHATLGTGAYTDGHGISANTWWDLTRNKERPVSSVEDERYPLLGIADKKVTSAGASPLNLRASTIGDSLRLATQGQSRVFGISLKDRAAILPVGYSANGAYWIDPASGAFITSSYYMSALPDWVTAFNTGGRIEQAEQEAGSPVPNKFYDSVGRTPAANSYELDFARALVSSEYLGMHSATDLLTISLSANDILGHQVGPDSPEERAMIDGLDQQLDSFFTWLEKNIPGGLPSVWIALSADHGVAPVPAVADQLGLPAATIDLGKLTANLNDAMNAKFSPGEKIQYLLPNQELPYIALNRPSFEVAGINEQEAEQAIQQAVPAAFASLAPAPPGDGEAQAPDGAETAAKSAAQASTLSPNAAQQPNPQANPNPAPSPTLNSGVKPSPATQAAPSTSSAQRTRSSRGAATAALPDLSILPPPPARLPPVPVVVGNYTRQQLAAGAFPPSEWGLLLSHSYSPNGGWYVMVIPADFEMPKLQSGTTHFSPWSYDRHVPLGLYGAPFTPGIYRGRVEPVDLAATLASLLGVNQPSASIGHVLNQAIHAVPPETPVRRRHPASTAVPPAPGQTPAPAPVQTPQ